MKLVSLRDVADLSIIVFPRSSQRHLRRLSGIRRALSRVMFRRIDAGPGNPFTPAVLSMMRLAADSSHQQRARAVRVDGQEHLEAALARGRGAILWEIPFGDPTLGKIALRQRGFSLVQVRGPWHGGARTWFGQHVI